jgi:hypothetical protein
MPIDAGHSFRHNFAIWVMGKRPGFFKPQRYVYRCLRCKWAFVVNDEYRGSIRVAADKAGDITVADAEQRLATFECGPCPGYQNVTETAEHSWVTKIIPLRRENRRATTARDASVK